MAKVSEVTFDAQANEDLGEIKITTGVLESITVQVTSEIDGVVVKSSGFQREVGSFLGMERDRVRADITSDEEGNVVIDIEIWVKYGYSVPEIAMKIQEKVKEQILYMTDLVVQEVNVHILGIETEPAISESYTLGSEDTALLEEMDELKEDYFKEDTAAANEDEDSDGDAFE